MVCGGYQVIAVAGERVLCGPYWSRVPEGSLTDARGLIGADTLSSFAPSTANALEMS